MGKALKGGIFAFISIDKLKARADHRTLLPLPAPQFDASFSRRKHPNERGKKPWPQAPLLSASVTSCTPA